MKRFILLITLLTSSAFAVELPLYNTYLTYSQQVDAIQFDFTGTTLLDNLIMFKETNDTYSYKFTEPVLLLSSNDTAVYLHELSQALQMGITVNHPLLTNSSATLGINWDLAKGDNLVQVILYSMLNQFRTGLVAFGSADPGLSWQNTTYSNFVQQVLGD